MKFTSEVQKYSGGKVVQLNTEILQCSVAYDLK